MGNSNSASSSRITAQDKAILDMKVQRDKLHQYQRRITTLTQAETNAARHNIAAGNKRLALLALRRKKYQETLLAQTDSQLAQLEQLTQSVEFALIQKDVLFGLEQGTAVLKAINDEMGGIAHVEKLMGESADAVAYQEQVSEMLGGRISNHDEDEVEGELAALEAEMNPDKARKEEEEERQRRRREQEQEQKKQKAGEMPSAPVTPLPEHEPEPASETSLSPETERQPMAA